MAEVTARKWRPNQFKDFVGQEYITSSLKMSLIQHKIANGYLFSGPRGVGKTSAARVLAKALNCASLLPDGEPCLICKSCEEIKAGKSVDVIEIDGASHRGIEKMREIKENLLFLPSYSPYKIYIIDEVHMLTTEAFNAILKMLEEPPSHVVFIFATTEIHKVKNTIRSRCQQFYFKRLNTIQIAGQLEVILKSYHISFQPTAIKLIAKASDGSMRDSQSILDQSIVYCDGEITTEKVKEILGVSSTEEFILFLKIISHEDGKAMENFVEDLYSKGIDITFFVVQLIEQFRILMLFYYNATDSLDIENSYEESLKELMPYFNVEQLHQIIRLLLILFKDLKETDNELFLIQATFFEILDYKSFIHLGTLVKKLELLENTFLRETGLTANTTISKQEEKILPSRESVSVEPIKEILSPEKKELEKDFSNHKTPEELFRDFVRNTTNPKWQGILADVRQVELKEKSLVLEFITIKFQEHFNLDTVLKKELLHFIKENNPTIIKLDSFVEKVDFSLKDKIDLLKEEFNGEELN